MSIETVSASVKEVVKPSASDSQSVKETTSVSTVDDNSTEDESIEESDSSEDNLDDNDSDTSVSEDDEEIKDELKEGQKPKKKNGFKKRIDKLTTRASKAEQELAYWKQAAMDGTGKSQDQAKQEKQPAKVDVSAKPNPEKFDSHEDYVEALTDWKIEEKEKAKDAKAKETEFKTQYQKQVTDFHSKVAVFSKATPDFDEVVSDVDDIPLTLAIQDAILTSDCGPELIYELSKNRAELQRINSLSPIAAARAIGNIEAKIGKSSEAIKTKTLTKTPPPISPIGGKSASSNKSLETMDYDEYKKVRMEQNKRK